MKEDVQDLPEVPKKRRQVEQALDLHLAMWLAGDLTPSERRRLEAEKARRKALVSDRRIGLVVADEGVTPAQLEALRDALRSSGATEVLHHGVSAALHRACRDLEVPVRVLRGLPRDVVRESDVLLAAPKDPGVLPYATPGVWAMIGYARHRKVPVRIVSPSGELLNDGRTG